MKEKTALLMNDAIIVDGQIWFSAFLFNGLFSIEIDTKNISYWGRFPGETVWQEQLYSCVIHVEGKLYFIPYRARRIGVFDLKEKTFSDIAIMECEDELGAQCVNAQAYKDYIFVFPNGYNGRNIVCVDTNTHNVEYIGDWCSDEIHKNKQKELFSKQTYLVDGKIYIPMYSVNRILELDCETRAIQLHVIDESGDGLGRLIWDEKNFWAISYNGKESWLLCLDRNFQVVKKIILQVSKMGSFPFIAFAKIKDKIVLFNTQSCAYLPSDEEVLKVVDDDTRFIRECNGTLLQYDANTRCIRLWDLMSGYKQSFECLAEGNCIPLKEEAESVTIIENIGKELRSFLDLTKDYELSETKNNENIGRKIYENLI